MRVQTATSASQISMHSADRKRSKSSSIISKSSLQDRRVPRLLAQELENLVPDFVDMMLS